MESFLLDQYKIRAKLDVLKDDVQAVIPITKVFVMLSRLRLLIPFLHQDIHSLLCLQAMAKKFSMYRVRQINASQEKERK